MLSICGVTEKPCWLMISIPNAGIRVDKAFWLKVKFWC